MSMFFWIYQHEEDEGDESEHKESFSELLIAPHHGGRLAIDSVVLTHPDSDHFSAVKSTFYDESSPQYLLTALLPASLEPPRKAERLLLLLLSRNPSELSIIGDLSEEFFGIASRHGIRFAKIWYWKQVAASAFPFLRVALRSAFLALIGEWIRRRI
jgi:hypothetical protein